MQLYVISQVAKTITRKKLNKSTHTSWVQMSLQWSKNHNSCGTGWICCYIGRAVCRQEPRGCDHLSSGNSANTTQNPRKRVLLVHDAAEITRQSKAKEWRQITYRGKFSLPWMQQSTLSHDSSSTNLFKTIFLKMVLFQRSSIFGTSKKKKNIKKEKKASKMGEKGLQRIYQMKDLNPELQGYLRNNPI